MARTLILIVVLALAAIVPAAAQEGAANDTSALGRQAEGIPTDAEPGQVGAPETNPNVTTREGVETQKAGGEYAGQQEIDQTGQAADEREVTGQTGVTERAAQTEQRETTIDAPDPGLDATDTGISEDEGREMPTTASPLPLIAVVGLAALGIGLGLRAAARRS